MYCLFCGHELALERSLRAEWRVVCPDCGFGGPRNGSSEEAAAQYTDAFQKLRLTADWVFDWANYRACDSNGKIFEYEKRPKKREYDWDPNGGRFQYLGRCPVFPDWEKSLEKRKADEAINR